MIDQIISWWIENFSIRLEGNPPPSENMILSAVGITGIVLYDLLLTEYFGLRGSQYLYLNVPLMLITMAFSARIVSQFYIIIGNAIAKKCNHLSSILLNYHNLQPNPSIDEPIPAYISRRESVLACLFCLIGSASGIFVSGAMFYSLLRVLGLPENIDPFVCYTPATLFGGVPGCIFGFTTGRLVEHTPEIISKRLEKRRSYQQARIIITLNDLPSNLAQNRYFPPEVLSIIHRYLIKTEDEKTSIRVIKEVIDEHNIKKIIDEFKNNICNTINEKIGFFSPRSRIDNEPLLPIYHLKNS